MIRPLNFEVNKRRFPCEKSGRSGYNSGMKVLLSFAMLLAPLAFARASSAPTVSPRLLSAKTGCIHMLHGTDKDMAEARKELKNWGRYKLVDECSKAEVTILIIARYSREVETCGAVVQVQDTANQAILWTGNQKCKTRTDVVVGHILRSLRAEVTKADVASHPKKTVVRSQHHR